MESFAQIIQSPTPVLLDFYADWCGPCQSMTPVIQDLAASFRGSVRVLKINIDKNSKAAAQFQVLSVPTFILLKQGQPLWRHSGTLHRAEFERAVRAVL